MWIHIHTKEGKDIDRSNYAWTRIKYLGMNLTKEVQT